MLTPSTAIRYLGIVAREQSGDPPFGECRFYAKLCTFGERLGLNVFVFSPERVDLAAQTVTGYRYSPGRGKWLRETFPLPDLLYDRAFCKDAEESIRHRKAMRALLLHKPIPFLGRGLTGKREVHAALLRYPALRPHLPETAVYRRPSQVLVALRRWGDVILKPAGGSHGKGVLHLSEQDGSYRLCGRGSRNESIELRFDEPLELIREVRRLIGGRVYLIQQYLFLRSARGDAFDVRSLAQKDGTGHWQITGLAVRQGAPGSLTANLHGGGRAEPLLPFLEREFGPSPAKRIHDTLQRLSRLIPLALERHFGRLAELGLDFGVDRDGRVWIIEVNSKPGRAAFEADTAGRLAGERSVRNPVDYARFLLASPIPVLREHH